MKCFILKTQDDLSIELWVDASLSLPEPRILWGRTSRAALLRPPRPVDSSSKEPLLSSHSVCGLEVNVDTTSGIFLSVPVWFSPPEPYAGLGQGECHVCAGASKDLSVERGGDWFWQRLQTSPEIMSVFVFDRAHPLGKIKGGLKQTALSRVPWWEDQCKS